MSWQWVVMAINKIRETLNNSRPSFLPLVSSPTKTFHTWKSLEHENTEIQQDAFSFYYFTTEMAYIGDKTKPGSTYKSNLVKETF